MEKVKTKISELDFTEFGTLSAKCLQVVDMNDLQTLFAAKGGNTFVVFLRGLDSSKLEEFKTAMLGKEIEIIYHDFSISELSPTYNSLKWVDGDGESHVITKVRASTANLACGMEELRQMALDSMNARIANGAELE